MGAKTKPNKALNSDDRKLAPVSASVIATGSEDDALHIAIAATQGVDYLLTWNFKHINNTGTKKLITRVVESLGYVCPLLCSPVELGGTSND